MVLSLECLCYVLSSASGLTACCYGFCCHCRCCCCCRDHFKTKVIHARSSCSSKIQVRQSEELILKCISRKLNVNVIPWRRYWILFFSSIKGLLLYRLFTFHLIKWQWNLKECNVWDLQYNTIIYFIEDLYKNKNGMLDEHEKLRGKLNKEQNHLL